MKVIKNFILLVGVLLLMTSCFDPELYGARYIALHAPKNSSFLDKLIPKNSVKIVQDGQGMVFAIFRDDNDNIKIYPVTDTP